MSMNRPQTRTCLLHPGRPSHLCPHPHPRLSQSPGLGSPCHIPNSHWLSILHMIIIHFVVLEKISITDSMDMNLSKFQEIMKSLMPLSDFPASTLMGTQAPHPTCLLLMGPASVLHPLSLSPQSLHSQDPPLASYSLMGHPAPHSARVPREPSVSPGMTFSCPHVQPCGLGSLLPPGSFSLLCLCYPSAWHPAPG